MTKRPTSLMLYNKNSVISFIPDTHAVYYLRGIADENSLYPVYFIGRSKKKNLRRELLETLIKNDWIDIVYVNYIECESEKEAEFIERKEISRHHPKYNQNNYQHESYI